ncbi:MAG TPA: hypothetical protein DCM32_00440 [Xanthomonadaceae bacterium]|jgi:hypothetical protein|nr:hypothetical protein [Xanthomonadaceae bacterium]
MPALAANALRPALHLLLVAALLAQVLAVGAMAALHELASAGERAQAVAAFEAIPANPTAPPCHPAPTPDGPAGDETECTGLCLWVCSVSFAALSTPAANASRHAPAAVLPANIERFHSLATAPPQRPPIAA